MSPEERVDAAYARLQAEMTRVCDDHTSMEAAESIVERAKQIRRAVRKYHKERDEP